MPRFRHLDTDVVVDVSDETALLLGSEYQLIEPEKKASAKKPASSKSEK